MATGDALGVRIEIGTGVIDMWYENPFYMVEDAGADDLIAGDRLQLGIYNAHVIEAILTHVAPGLAWR